MNRSVKKQIYRLSQRDGNVNRSVKILMNKLSQRLIEILLDR